MQVRELLEVLESSPGAALAVQLPGGSLVPAHFHVTEVGRVEKRFIDCGGTRRQAVSCLLQIWVAGDTDHRLSPSKLAAVLRLAEPVLESWDLPVEIEFGPEVAAQYELRSIEIIFQRMMLVLAAKQTDCLARDKCGVEACAAPGCCST